MVCASMQPDPKQTFSGDGPASHTPVSWTLGVERGGELDSLAEEDAGQTHKSIVKGCGEGDLGICLNCVPAPDKR